MKCACEIERSLSLAFRYRSCISAAGLVGKDDFDRALRCNVDHDGSAAARICALVNSWIGIRSCSAATASSATTRRADAANDDKKKCKQISVHHRAPFVTTVSLT